MTINYTANIGLGQPVTGTESGTWGDDVNNSITSYLDIAIAGTNNITTDADVTLTLTQGTSSSTGITSTSSQYYVLNCTGSRSLLRNILVPTSGGTVLSKTYVVINNTTGGFGITIKKSGGTGVTVAAGETAIVYANPVAAVNDVVKISSSILTNLTGILTGTNGGTGVNNGSSTITIGGNLTFSGAYTTAVTVTGNTAVTLPVSGTLGYQNIPQNSQSAAYTTVAADAGKCIFHPASDANARTFTIDSNANVPYALGTVIQFINMSANNVTIAITSDTLTWAQGGGTGSRTLAQNGVANCVKVGTTQWLLTGTNVT